MNISTKTIDSQTTVAVEGMLDSASAAQFQEFAGKLLDSEKIDLVFDLSGLEYTSSQGIRTFLTLMKKAQIQQGKIVFRHIRPAVREVFDMAGLSQIMNIEE